MRQNSVVQFVQLLKCWLCNMRSGVVTERTWNSLLADAGCRHCSFQVSHWFAEHTSQMSWFHWIQKAGVDQTCSRPPNSDRDPVLLHACLWEVLWSFFSVQPQSSSSLVVIYNPLFNAHHNPLEKLLLLGRIRDDNSEHQFFLICGQLTRHPLIELFHLSNLLQMLNDGRVVDVGFFGNFLCTYKRISSRDCSQLIVVNFWWLANMLFIFKALVSFAKLLKPSLHCVLIRNSWARCIVDVASCLCCFMTHFELK